MVKPGALILLAAMMMLAELSFAVSIELAEPYPLKGQPTTITVSDTNGPVEGAVVVVTYRPNSQTGTTEVLAATNRQGTVTWNPRDAGIVTLAAHRRTAEGEMIASVNDSVRFGSFPGSGLIVMIAAGMLLFGGASLGLTMLFREGQMPDEPPST